MRSSISMSGQQCLHLGRQRGLDERFQVVKVTISHCQGQHAEEQAAPEWLGPSACARLEE